MKLHPSAGSAPGVCHPALSSRHFRLPRHEAHQDIVMLPIELVSPRDPFLLKARESFNIIKLKSEKLRGVCEIEHGLNLDEVQVKPPLTCIFTTFHFQQFSCLKVDFVRTVGHSYR